MNFRNDGNVRRITLQEIEIDNALMILHQELYPEVGYHLFVGYKQKKFILIFKCEQDAIQKMGRLIFLLDQRATVPAILEEIYNEGQWWNEFD